MAVSIEVDEQMDRFGEGSKVFLVIMNAFN